MTVVGLHPEELFDKLLDGEISPLERERLRAHLDACEVCRFEYAARLDFQEEARGLASLGAPPASPLRMPQPLVEGSRAPLRRRRSRLWVWGIAAAALISASGAVASVLSGKAPWRAVSVMLSHSKAAPAPAVVKKLPRAATSCVGADCEEEGSAVAPVTSSPPAVPSLALARPAPAPERGDVVAEPALRRVAATRVASPRPRLTRAEAALPASTGASVEKEPVVPEAPREVASAAKLFAEANQARRSGDVGRASGLYHLLQDQYPGSAEAELSRVTLALLLLDSGDAQAALKGFERYLAGGSRGLEAEALVGRARALGRLGRRDLETAAWREVQRKFPRSIYGRQATERLAVLGQP